MKKFLVLSAELLSFIAVGLCLGLFLDKVFSWEGWATLVCLILVYALWFLKLFKKLR
ncbi:MAG: AtpZ/AtpI family protein [Oligoflexia bacterium]|nr:AtpZ/AtpI family protein [Oligoflexia bacterium]